MKPLSILCSTIFFLSCNTASDYSKEISKLDSLHVLIVQIEPEFRTIDKSKIVPIADSVMNDLKYIEENYEGYMREDLGKLFSQYRTITKLLPDFDKKFNSAESEIETTKMQLARLSEALKNKATHDSAGNRMTDEYVRNAVAAETMMAESLISTMKYMTERSATMTERYDSLRPLVKFYVDSIPQKTRP